MSIDADEIEIRRAAVLGAGAMGAQIAALIASRGVPCDLLDLDTALAERAKQRLLTLRPPALEDDRALALIRPGSFAADLPRLADADLVIEAVIERLAPKLDLWTSAAPHLRDTAILTTNTSGIPIRRIARALPPDARRRFLGAHFFNPPRYLPLLELIPTAETDTAPIAALRRFAERILDKRVVIAKDVPGFITNRIGCYYFLAAMRAADELGLAPDEADAVSGPLMGRPGSATYRTLDIVGLDILANICDNTRAALASEWERAAFDLPPYIREMLRRGWLGDKSGQGFYKRERADGRSRILTLHPREMRYRERQTSRQESLARLQAIKDTPQRIRALVASDDAAGKFAWRALSHLLVFAAAKAGEVAHDIISIDRAMRWGFNWQLGPFETWDALGVANAARRMINDGLPVPEWTLRLADAGGSFYKCADGVLMQADPAVGYIPAPRERSGDSHDD